MQSLNQLLDKCKAARSLRSDAALAEAAGVTKGSVSNWRHGRNLPAPHVILRLATIANEDGLAWVARVEEQRAEQADKQVWHRLAQRLATAAVVALTIGLSPAHAEASKAAQSAAQNSHVYTLCEIKRARRWLGTALAWLLSLTHGQRQCHAAAHA